MIISSSSFDSAARPQVAYVEHVGMSSVSTSTDGGDAGSNEPEITLVDSHTTSGNEYVIQAPIQYDWQDARIHNRFARLEAKVLAGRSNAKEEQQYKEMRKSRMELLRGINYLENYAETERLKKLAVKLREIQILMQPVRREKTTHQTR